MINKINIILKNLKTLFFFTKFIYVLLILCFFSVILETIGFLTLLPLINLTTGDQNDNIIIEYFLIFFNYLNLDFNQINLIILIFILFLIKGLLVFIQKYYSSSLIVYLRIRLRNNLIEKISKIKFDFYNSSKKSIYTNAIITEVSRFLSGINNLVKLLFILIAICVYLPTTFIIDFKISLFFYSSLIILIITLVYLTKRTRGYSLNVTAQNEIIQSLVNQYINFMGYFKSTNLIKKINIELRINNEKLLLNEKKIIFNSVLLDSIKEPLTVFLILILFFYKISVSNDNLAGFFVYLIIIYKLLLQTLSIPNYFQKIMSMSGGVESIENIERIAKKNIEIDNQISKKQIITRIDSLLFKDVYFNFKDKIILNNINFTVNEKDNFFIFGQSGSGKSTILKIITYLLTEFKGQVKFNNLKIQDIEINHIRGKIGYVPQEGLIFNDTLWNNVTLWANFNESNIQKFNNLIKGLDIDFVDILDKDYYNKHLGDLGSKISGGQKQKIVLAREIYKNPDILLLDEATANIDAISENRIFNYIGKLNLIRIIVTHNSNLIDKQSKVLFIDKGKTLFEGSFDDALKNKVFKKIYDYQRLFND